ncbi:YggT family protein [Georgenia halophila]|uniref:YggT family protein n=1 Tax=Georgenia halophila TaxID=620889 RepID=A0ABP8L7W7_9MICO
MLLVYQLLQLLLLLYIFVLLARLVFDWIQVFARDWRPRGFLLVIANGIYGLTDPPLRFLRRYIKPLSLGQIQLDLSFLVLFLAVSLLRGLVLPLIFSALVA